ncbi:MAG: hypothetical protein ABI051_05070 [Vicinamibacterales bacterium]
MYGKKADRWPQLGAGVLLMLYPYFVSTALQMFVVGSAVIIGLCLMLWLGW